MNKVKLYDYLIGRGEKLTLLAGPCVLEGLDRCLLIGRTIKEICQRLDINYVFKASFDKANRSSYHSFRGPGLKKGLEMLKTIKEELGVPVVTDIHAPEEASMAAEFVDVLQIPAFLCRQTDLLVAAAKTSKTVNIKKGQFLSPSAMSFVAEKVRQSGNNDIMLTDRGTFFGYHDLIVDYRSIPTMQKLGCPVVLDCTHSLQQPNQSSGVTGGDPEMIETIAKAGVAVGADGRTHKPLSWDEETGEIVFEYPEEAWDIYIPDHIGNVLHLAVGLE